MRRHSPLALAVGGALVLFGTRRVVLALAALAPSRPPVSGGRLPSVAFVVPARDEGASLPRLLPALDAIDYAGDLTIVLVDDGSTDGSGEAFVSWAAERPCVRVVSLPAPGGTAAALNAGIAEADDAEVVVACDADLEPEPGSLLALVGPFADGAVGAVAGYRRPVNSSAGSVAAYAALESWLTQLVTSAGKDRLALDPPTLGWAAYRRAALDEVGGFDAGLWGWDVAASTAIAERGWTTRFTAAAVAGNRVVTDLRSYTAQRWRWQRNTLDAAPASGSLVRRLETTLAAAGYADRVALLAACALAATGRLPWRLPCSYAAVRGVEVGVALRKAGAGRDSPRHVLAAFALFPVDLAMSAVGVARGLRRRSGTWESPPREMAGA